MQVLGILPVAQRVLREVVVVLDEGRGRPHEVVVIDHLTHRVQVTAVLQVEHLTANEHGRLGKSRHRERAQDGIRLDCDVVVHVEDVRAVGEPQRLVHDARVAARAAEVALVEDVQPIAERCGSFLVAGLVDDVARALVGHEHGVDHRVHQRIRRERGQCIDRVRRPVEGRDADGDALGLRACSRCNRRIPTRRDDFGVGVGGDVEPDPSAVFERT